MLRRHHAALINIHDAPFDPDFDRYFALERMGQLFVLVARYQDMPVGYAIWSMAPHVFHSTLAVATNDTFWLEPEHREWTNGLQMFILAEEELRALGIKLLYAYAQIDFEITHRGVAGKLLTRLGFKPMDQLYIKDLRDERRRPPSTNGTNPRK